MSTKITLYIATSIDGFIAKKDGSVKWLDKFNNLGENYGYESFSNSINTVVMGNVTYEQVLGFGEYPYKNKQGYVFANKEKSDDNIIFVNGDVKEFIDNLDKEKDHNIWLIGGANIVNQFLKYNLIDEFIIFVMPVILGEGIRLFSNDNQEKELILTNSKSFKSGVLELKYKKG